MQLPSTHTVEAHGHAKRRRAARDATTWTVLAITIVTVAMAAERGRMSVLTGRTVRTDKHGGEASIVEEPSTAGLNCELPRSRPLPPELARCTGPGVIDVSRRLSMKREISRRRRTKWAMPAIHHRGNGNDENGGTGKRFTRRIRSDALDSLDAPE